MELTYLCPACCEAGDIKFYATAENSAGRKSCSVCGTVKPYRFMIVTAESVLASLARGLLKDLAKTKAELRVAYAELAKGKASAKAALKPKRKSAQQLQLDRIEAMTRASLARFYGHGAVEEALVSVGQEDAVIVEEVVCLQCCAPE